MKRLLRKLIPNKLVNYGKHLPTAVLANIKYRFPSKGMKVVGITGTDGKTTTTNMIYRILKEAGVKVSMISTISAVIGDKKFDTGFHVTSPSSLDLQKLIKRAKSSGTEVLILEATSHALEQFRMWGIKFDIGVITNITHEHLDYHKTFDNYKAAKAKLIKNVRVAVLNRDDKNFEWLRKKTFGKVVSFGLTKNANFNPQKFRLKLKIPGGFNTQNALAAAAVAVNLRVPAEIIKRVLENFEGLPGRMEEVPNKLGIKIFVDFAHTQNALENALKSLKEKKHSRGKIISVFGCASERDTDKRPVMGEISGKYADITILTDEDPRFEDPTKIINEIAEGVIRVGGKEGENLFKEPNRQLAIKLAIKKAKDGDIIGIFGKGHERSMNYKGIEKEWSDIEAVKKAWN